MWKFSEREKAQKKKQLWRLCDLGERHVFFYCLSFILNHLFSSVGEMQCFIDDLQNRAKFVLFCKINHEIKLFVKW